MSGHSLQNELHESSVSFESNYVQINIGNGEFTAGCIETALFLAMDICVDKGFRRILALPDSPHVPGTDTDSLGQALNRIVVLPGVKLACCFFGFLTEDLRASAIEIAARHGLTIRFFADRDEALKWLGAR